jgi:predicted anti-sigma-YlaC factor YlaD
MTRRSLPGSGDPPTRIDCRRAREITSANLDGEAGPDECLFLADHLTGCASCRRFQTQASALHRFWRLRPAPDVPDLSDTILGAGEAVGVLARRRTSGLLRLALATVVVIQLALAGPGLVHRTGSDGDLNHLDAWAVGFALGLLVAVAQPRRARGLLPLAAALGSVMAVTVGLDIVHGHAIAMPAATHVTEVTGVALLWALAWYHRDPGAPGAPWPRSWRRRSARAPDGLRVIDGSDRNPDVA